MKKSSVLKWTGYGLLAVVLAGAGVFVFRANTSSSRIVLKDELQIQRKLLHNAAGEHGCHCFSPFIASVTISNITSSGASIHWICDQPSSYQVKYGTTSTKGTYFPTATPAVSYKDHTVILTGLQPKTLYHVGPSSICLSNCQNNATPNLRKNVDSDGKGDWTFTTLPATSVLQNQSESRETARTAISEVTVAKVTAKDVTITWKTNNPATSLIEYGLTTAYGSKTGENTLLERDHDIQLFDLKFGATYHARAVSKDASTGKASYSSDFTFRTPTFEDRIANLLSPINEPNPCSDRTVFVYYLYQPVKRMTIDILTLSGKIVATLESPQSTLREGYNKVLWDVRDNTQKRLPNGLYAYRMRFQTANNEVEVTKSNLMVRR
jgi:hypothetical protein